MNVYEWDSDHRLLPSVRPKVAIMLTNRFCYNTNLYHILESRAGTSDTTMRKRSLYLSKTLINTKTLNWMCHQLKCICYYSTLLLIRMHLDTVCYILNIFWYLLLSVHFVLSCCLQFLYQLICLGFLEDGNTEIVYLHIIRTEALKRNQVSFCGSILQYKPYLCLVLCSYVVWLYNQSLNAHQTCKWR